MLRAGDGKSCFHTASVESGGPERELIPVKGVKGRGPGNPSKSQCRTWGIALPAGARRSALAAAGKLAVGLKVLPRQLGLAEPAVATIPRTWIVRRPDGSGSAEAAAQLDQARTVLVQHWVRASYTDLDAMGLGGSRLQPRGLGALPLDPARGRVVKPRHT